MLLNLIEFSDEVFRVDSYNDPKEALTDDGLASEELVQMILFARLPEARVHETILRVFEPRQAEIQYSVGRFSDGSYPVLYCALEIETAIAEKSHHLSKDDWFRLGFPAHYSIFSVAAAAMCADLRNPEYSRDELTSDNYSTCREIARSAIQQSIGVLLSHSARYFTGTTAPLLTKQAVRGVKEQESFVIKFDPAAAKLVVIRGDA